MFAALWMPKTGVQGSSQPLSTRDGKWSVEITDIFQEWKIKAVHPIELHASEGICEIACNIDIAYAKNANTGKYSK